MSFFPTGNVVDGSELMQERLDTANELEDDSDYSHISVLSGIKQYGAFLSVDFLVIR